MPFSSDQDKAAEWRQGALELPGGRRRLRPCVSKCPWARLQRRILFSWPDLWPLWGGENLNKILTGISLGSKRCIWLESAFIDFRLCYKKKYIYIKKLKSFSDAINLKSIISCIRHVSQIWFSFPFSWNCRKVFWGQSNQEPHLKKKKMVLDTAKYWCYMSGNQSTKLYWGKHGFTLI